MVGLDDGEQACAQFAFCAVASVELGHVQLNVVDQGTEVARSAVGDSPRDGTEPAAESAQRHSTGEVPGEFGSDVSLEIVHA